MPSDAFPALDHLLSAYFHQDWEEDHGTAAAVLREFAATTRRPEVSAAADDVDRFLAASDPGSDLRRRFEAEFAPMVEIGDTDEEARRWLTAVRDGLRRLAPSAPD